MDPRTARSASPILFAAAILVFFLPFASVSCAGEEVMTVTGMQLVTGVTVERSDFFGNQREERILDPEPLSIIALLAGVSGLGVALFRRRRAEMGKAALGSLGAVALLVFYGRATSEAASQEIPMVVEMRPGYWLALLSFAAAAAINGFVWLQGRTAAATGEAEDPI